VLFAVASECASTNSWTAAESNYTAAIMLGNASPVLYYARGRAEQNSGNTRAALEDYDRAVSLDPSYEEALSARSALRADKHGKDGSSGQRPLTIPR
jgi:tetratricopeptide (TPR) repeat protein